MSVLIKHMAMTKGCIYANDKDQTEYCPLLNHDDVPFCQYIENEPEIAIGIDERPVYCPLSDVPEPCQDTIYRQDAIDAFGLSEKTRKYGGDHSGYDTRMLYEIQDVLEGLPSAQPERKTGEWTPCSERLPEIKEHHTSEPCIVYCDNEAYAFAELEENIFGQVGWNCERDDDYHEAVGTVIAWMPLPEPYKGEEA